MASTRNVGAGGTAPPDHFAGAGNVISRLVSLLLQEASATSMAG